MVCLYEAGQCLSQTPSRTVQCRLGPSHDGIRDSFGFKIRPGFESDLSSVRKANVTKNSRHGGWTGDWKAHRELNTMHAESSFNTTDIHFKNATCKYITTALTHCSESYGQKQGNVELEQLPGFQRPEINWILTPGSNPLRKPRRTGNNVEARWSGSCSFFNRPLLCRVTVGDILMLRARPFLLLFTLHVKRSRNHFQMICPFWFSIVMYSF